MHDEFQTKILEHIVELKVDVAVIKEKLDSHVGSSSLRINWLMYIGVPTVVSVVVSLIAHAF